MDSSKLASIWFGLMNLAQMPPSHTQTLSDTMSLLMTYGMPSMKFRAWIEICLLEASEIILHANEQLSEALTKTHLSPAGAGLYSALPQAGERLEAREGKVQYSPLNIIHRHILLSTNVFMVRFPTERERKLFASWMLSVFWQIQLELVSAAQEGMRKGALKNQLQHLGEVKVLGWKK